MAGRGCWMVLVASIGWGLACVLRWYQLQLLINQEIDERQAKRIHEHLRDLGEE